MSGLEWNLFIKMRKIYRFFENEIVINSDHMYTTLTYLWIFVLYQEQVRCFSRGFHTTESRQYGIVPPQEPSALLYKPWKKHHNKNKKEKLRRLVKN